MPERVAIEEIKVLSRRERRLAQLHESARQGKQIAKEHNEKTRVNRMKKGLPEGWRQIVREHGLIEWVCPHGIGHPAPNEIQPDDMKDYPGHGCDGCCAKYFRPPIVLTT